MSRRVSESKRVEATHEQAPPVRRMIKVGAADDHAEAHADQLAHQALALSADYAPAPSVHRSAPAAPGSLAGELELDPAALGRASGSAQRLDADTAQRMGAGFGHDFSDVRVHTGGAAATLAADLGARAFTHGQDIYFGAGEYQPGTSGGDEVLSHELAHTVQDGGAVHRFPATWINQPVPWSAQTANVRRPGGGISGGVYILTSADGNGPVQTAVVKPTFGKNGAGDEESGAQIVAADRMMTDFGLNAPASRLVRKGTAEYNDLVALLTPRQPVQPALGEPGHKNWKALAEADDFVVMSEIVNAKTVMELAQESGGSNEAKLDLVSAINNQKIMHDLGLMMIADMVLGNSDRFLGEAKNLGNVMISVLNGQRSLNVFDTTAFLPEEFETKELLANAMVKPGLNLKFTTRSPKVLLGEMLEAIVQVVEDNEPPVPVVQGGVAPPTFSQRFRQAIKSCEPKLLGWFMTGWDAGIAHALTLASGNNAKDALGDVADEKNVSADTMKAMATYVGNAAGAQEDKTAGAKGAAQVLPKIVRAVDLKSISPDGGVVDPGMWTKVPSDVTKADWVDNPDLPAVAELQRVRPAAGQFDVAAYGKLKGKLAQAHGSVDTALPDKVRMGKAKPRNRAGLGKAVINAEAIAAGRYSLAAAARNLKTVAVELGGLIPVAAQLTKADAAELIPRVATIEAMIGQLERSNGLYSTALADATRVIPKTKFPDKVALGDALNEAVADGATVDKGVAIARKKKLDELVAALRARASSTTV